MTADTLPIFRRTRPRRVVARIVGTTLLALALSGCEREEEKRVRHAEEAEASFLSGDYNRAEIACKHLLRANGSDALSLARLGRIWLERGSPVQAAYYLSQAAKDARAPLDAKLDLARASIAIGDRPGARGELQEILAREAGNGDALILLASVSATDAEAAETEKAIASSGDPGASDVAVASAILALRKGDAGGADALLRQAIERDPLSPQANTWRARSLLTGGNPAEAEAPLAEAARLSPQRSAEKIEYASFLLSHGKRDAAIAQLNGYVAATPDFISAWRILAREALARKSHAEADRFLDRIFVKDALDVDAVFIQAQSWLEQGGEKRRAKAISLLDRLRERHPTNPFIEVLIARAHLQASQPELAAAAVQRALDHAPDHREAVLLKADLDLQGGKAANAARAIEAWIAKHPDDREAGRRLAESYRLLGRADDALGIYKSLASAPSSIAEDHLRVGQMLIERNQADEARAALGKAESLAPGDLRASMELVRLDIRQRRLDDALRRAEHMKTRQPESAPTRHLLALVLGGLERWEDAEREARESLRLDPGLGAARELLVRIYHATRRPEEALRELERIHKDDPGNRQASLALAAVKESSGDRTSAASIYRRLLAEDPDCVPALNNLAGILADTGGEELARARDLAEQARSLSPGDPAVADTLGWILFRQGAYKRARTLLSEAVGALEAHPTTRYHHAMACRAMGEAGPAEEWLGGAIELPGTFPERTRAEESFRELRQEVSRDDAGVRTLSDRVAKDPSDMVSRLRLGALLESLGRPDEAAATYLDCLAANPDLPAAASRLAVLYDGPLKNPEKAASHATIAREMNPGDQVATLILAGHAFRSGEHSRAAGLYRESLSALEKQADRRLEASLAFFSVARIDEARAVLDPLTQDPRLGDAARQLLLLMDPDCPESEAEKALLADPRSGPALAASAAAAERSGRIETAVTRFKTLVGLYPDFTPAREALSRLGPADGPSR